MSLRLRLTLPLALVIAGCVFEEVFLADADGVFTGSADSRFGATVESNFHADNNADSDVAIGASNDGVVYIYTNPTGALTEASANVTFTGAAGGEAGWSLASGRVVSTSIPRDLVIGAPSENGGRGKIYILAGGGMSGALDSSDAWATLSGSQTNEYAGWDVTVGDYNADGHRDVAVGACGFGGDVGRVFVAFGPFANGSNRLLADATQNLIIQGVGSDSLFGCAVSTGDLDNNGRDDLVIGARGFRDTALPPNGDIPGGAGRVYAIYNSLTVGSTTIDAGVLNVRHWTGTEASMALGTSVDASGDINGDGYDDIVMGADYRFCSSAPVFGPEECANFEPGSAFIVLGQARAAGGRVLVTSGPIDTEADVVFNGTVSELGFGFRTAYVGDHDGDGNSDLAISTREGNQVYVYYGAATISTTSQTVVTEANAAAVLNADNAETNFVGADISGWGDSNADGLSDILVGASGVQDYILSPADPGGAWLFLE